MGGVGQHQRQVEGRGAVKITAYGSDGCQATFVPWSGSGTAFPYLVERHLADDLNPFAKPAGGCTSTLRPGEQGWMDCATRSQAFTAIRRMVPWFGPDIDRSDYPVEATLCADGTYG